MFQVLLTCQAALYSWLLSKGSTKRAGDTGQSQSFWRNKRPDSHWMFTGGRRANRWLFKFMGLKVDLSSCGSDPWWWPPLSSYLCSVMFTTKQSWRANAPSYIVGGGRWESGSLWWVRGWNPRCSLVLASLQFGVRNTNTHMWSCSQRVFAATKTADENRFDVSPAQMFTDEVILCFYVVHQPSLLWISEDTKCYFE